MASGGGSIGPSPLLRAGVPGERRPLKEKLISYYENIFQVGSLLQWLAKWMTANKKK